MSNLIDAGFPLVVGTGLLVLLIRDRDEIARAKQVSLIAAIMSMMVMIVNILLPGGIPPVIFFPVALLLLTVLISGALYDYARRPEHERQTG